MENRATLANLINHPNPTNAVLAQKEKLIKQIRGKENQQQRGLPPDFIDKIDDLVKSFASTNGSSIVLQKSLWQADPAIAKHAIDGDVDAVLSGDSDFAMYVGGGVPDGCGDIMLRNPTLGKRNTHLESFEIWTGPKKVVKYINEILKPKVRQSIFQKDPQHPIFDGLDRIRFCALFALALGCDALPGGIDGFGAKKASIIFKVILIGSQMKSRSTVQVDTSIVEFLEQHHPLLSWMIVSMSSLNKLSSMGSIVGTSIVPLSI
ncbi:unnamed protein product [Cylindrotheca closterium]|uniref:Uncharacterized protein n=1 Tax=Cylindrotheca closterium TaxID=2856 RepID=A0AAD2PU62_9STRA|nr:unnamed protein product [Cylindrotheca closterium]